MSEKLVRPVMASHEAPAPQRKARMCILTQFFPPEMGAPQARLSELGERLIDAGWEVQTLTALPNYPTGQVFADYDRSKTQVESVGRIRTVRVPLYTSKTGFVKRLRSYFSFVAAAKKHGPRLCQRPDLLYVESPPLFIGFAARYLSKRWKCPYVLNVSDLWPESAVRMGVVKPGVATWFAERLELQLYRSSAGVTGQSSEIVESIRRRSPGTRTAVITNGVEPNRFGPHFADSEMRQLITAEPGPVFVYAGLLGLAQGLDHLVNFMARLPAETQGRLVLVGEGPMREPLEKQIREGQVKRVRILQSLPRERIPALLAVADVALISLGMHIPGAVPSKIYEAMAAALPILLIADGEPARRVRDAECGLSAAPGDVPSAIEAFRQLAGDAQLRARLGENGRRAAETTYNRARIAESLDVFLRSVLPMSYLATSSDRTLAKH